MPHHSPIPCFRRLVLALGLAIGLFLPWSLQAHEPSKSYLNLIVSSNGLTGRWDIPLRDLRLVTPLKLDRDGLISWDELTARLPAITTYASTHLKIAADDRPAEVHFTPGEPVVEAFADGACIELPFTIDSTPDPTILVINYQLFFETNSLHRGLLRLENNGKVQTAIFTPDHPVQRFTLGGAGASGQFLVFLREGVFHIWTGYDHILFLLALLLPAVLFREGTQWRVAPDLRSAFIHVVKIVTAFTVAHSLTLTLAACGIVKLPSRLTESAIAASVALAAANNLWPVVRERGWLVAFGFGLVHGFGFANALAELGLEHGALALRLVGFNLGVEAGQLAIVAAFLPAAFSLRRTAFYQKGLLQLGSATVILVAAVWLVERVGDFKVLPF